MAAAGLRCGSATIKYLLFFFNFIFVLCGIALIVIGALALKALSVAGTGYNAAIILIIVVGCIIFVVSFYGCCGAIRESHCMLITFAVFLMVIIVAEIVCVILVFVNSGSSSVQSAIETVFYDAYNNDTTAEAAVDTVQEVFDCCGYTGPSYWDGTTFPSSCCSSSVTTCNSTTSYQTTCKEAIGSFIETYGKISGAVGIAVAVIEILGVWFSLGLAGSIRDLERAMR